MNQVQNFRLVALGAHEWPYFLTTYVMSIMATFLTGVWELSITHASQIMNLYSGTVFIMAVIVILKFGQLSNPIKSTFYCSKLAFLLGFVMLTISASGTCREDEPLCISSAKQCLFYTSLFTLAAAVAAHEIWSEPFMPFMPEQYYRLEPLTRFLLLVIPLGALAAIGYTSPWWIKFLIPTICVAISFLDVPDFTDIDNEELLVYVNNFDESEEDEWTSQTLCLSVFSILVSAVFTVGNTFFILQAIDLSPKLWFLKIAAVSLPVIKEFVKTNLSCISCSCFIPRLSASMVCTTLCCITAAKVETRRLGVVVSEGVVDDSDTIIPMTIFWLVPQYVLLGLAEKGLDDHFQSKTDSGKVVAGKIVNAVGFYCGVLWVYAVGKLEPSWIQDTVNTSRLDNYYWFLATVSAVNLVLYHSIIWMKSWFSQ